MKNRIKQRYPTLSQKWVEKLKKHSVFSYSHFSPSQTRGLLYMIGWNVVCIERYTTLVCELYKKVINYKYSFHPAFIRHSAPLRIDRAVVFKTREVISGKSKKNEEIKFKKQKKS